MPRCYRVLIGIVFSLAFFPASAAAETKSAEEAANGSERTPAQDLAATIKAELVADKLDGGDDERAEHAAISAFYEGRGFAPLWVSDAGLNENAVAVALEIENAEAWGLDPGEFQLPQLKPEDANGRETDPSKSAAAELLVTRAALKYARHARGGRIMDPAEMLNSHLNRFPQLIPPDEVLAGLATADWPDDYLRGLHPKHDQFARLRQALLSIRDPAKTRLARVTDALSLGDKHSQVSILRRRLGLRRLESGPGTGTASDFDEHVKTALSEFQRLRGLSPADGVLTQDTVTALNQRTNAGRDTLLANMEQWRWMWEDLGDLYIFANVPEFMLNLVKYGDVIFRERIVVGEIGKQTSIFTRTLKHIVLRPMWRVPESIKVKELWPSLRGSGGLFREYGLQVETKDGRELNYRSIDWHTADIRDYEVVQPPGRNSVMGAVKFSFPSQHTIFMHDTPDKYMFKQRQRTLSHGCLRLRNPVTLAKMLLAEDKGWNASYIDDLIASGPNRNAVKIERRIPVHIVYFTAWADERGNVETFRDVYRHEKRITQALHGQWARIDKGRDHLAPPVPNLAPVTAGKTRPKERGIPSPFSHVGSPFGRLF